MLGEGFVILFYSEVDNWGARLEGLNENFGGIEVAATDAPDYLGNKLKSAFLGGIIWEKEASISLDNADGGEFWQIETFGDGLGANDDVDFTITNRLVHGVEWAVFGAISIKTHDVCIFEKLF